MLVDTHCHLFLDAFDADRAEVFARARKAGVRAFINVGIDEGSSRAAIRLAASEPDVWATVGLHPHSAHEADHSIYGRLEQLAVSPRVVGVGECGLDYVKSPAPKERQHEVFSQMIGVAGRRNLPLVVHSREAFADTLSLLAQGKRTYKGLKAVFHCFSYDAAAMRLVMDAGFFVSFTANVTFPNARAVREAAKEVPLDRFLIETDAPYLAPQAVRGKRNEPAYLEHLVAEIGRLKGITAAQAAEASTRNAAAFFGLPGLS